MSIEGYDWSNLERAKAPEGTWGVVGRKCAVAAVVTVVAVVVGMALSVIHVLWVMTAAAGALAAWVWVWITTHRALKRMGYDFLVEHRVGEARKPLKTDGGYAMTATVFQASVLGLVFGFIGEIVCVVAVVEGTLPPQAIFGAVVAAPALFAGGIYGIWKVGDDCSVLDAQRKLAKFNQWRLEGVRVALELEPSQEVV